MERTDGRNRLDIYNKKCQTLEKQEQKLNAWNGSECNKLLIKRFQQHLLAKGTTEERIAKVTGILRKTSDMLGKNMDAVDRDDAERFIGLVNADKKWSAHTKRDYRRTCKQFYLWHEEEDTRLNHRSSKVRANIQKFYKYVRKISTAAPRKALDYSRIITQEEKEKLLQHGCSNTMERAFVSTLHETGCRIGEILNLHIRDFERKGKHGMLNVDGKTGQRRVPIIQSIPYIEQWLLNHPCKNDPDAYLWMSTHNRWNKQPLRYLGARRLLDRVFAKAEVNKPKNPHWFRHSSATLNAPNYREPILCQMMGWSLGSKQVKTYIHLGAEQVEEEFKRQHNLIDEKKRVPTTQYCVCGAVNTGSARYCFKCGNAFSPATILEDEPKRNAAMDEVVKTLSEILSNPEKQKEFTAFKEQWLKEKRI